MSSTGGPQAAGRNILADFWRIHLQKTLSDQGLAAYVWDIDTDHIEWQGDIHALLGFDDPAQPVSSADFARVINPQDIPARLAAFHDVLALQVDPTTPPAMKANFRIRRGNGLQVGVYEHATLQLDPDNGHRMLCGTVRIADEKQFSNAVKPATNLVSSSFSMVSYDTSMTHYGRLLICQKIVEWTDAQNSSRLNNVGYLLVIGIDRLSMLNEAFGAQYTDEVIDRVGKRLRDLVGGSATVARIDGDVFGVFFAHAPHAEMAAVAHHMLHNFYEVPIQTQRGPVGISISIGGVHINRQCKDPADMLTRAEMAMQTAKERGRGRFVSYGEAATEAQNTRLLLSSGDAFLRALKDNRVKLAFQPVVNSRSSGVSFHECLIRFVDESGKLHSAGNFMPAIERLGLSRLVDRYAMHLAIQELAAFSDLTLSVNVSNLTLTDPDWLRGLVSALRERPDVAGRLIVEITESVAMYDLEKTMRIVRTLRDMGCRVALDDFGAGYTAFAQLKRLDVDMVKIDKSFIRKIDETENRLFVKTLNTLAQGVNVQTVGEGAETMSEAKLLAGDGVDHIQGYVFGFPSVERVWLPREHSLRKILQHHDEPRPNNDMTAEQIMELMKNQP